MQPTLVLSASHPGLIYLNGHFAGEISAEAPLIRPVGSRGAVYLEYRPLTNIRQTLARKLVLAGGVPMPESVEEAENLNIILWPGGAVEVELSPEPLGASVQHFHLGGHSFSLDGASHRLMCDGRQLGHLPDGAEIPQLHTAPSGAALVGKCAGGNYLLSMDSAFQSQTGFLVANQLDIEPDGCIRAVASPSDLVGHATLESWRLTPEGLMLISSEPAWANGTPRWPKTPEETARAAVEAVLAGLESEAEGYLSPALRSRMPLSNIRERCDLCVDMKYAPPDSRPCVGLLHLDGDRLGRVFPLYFRVSPSGGPQGPYLIEEFEYI